MAHGARAVDGVHVSVKRVPELMPEEVMRQAGMKVDQPAPIADPQELANYDAIIFGTPTRFGNMSSQMRNFLDQTGPLWVERRADRQGRQRVHLDLDRRRQRDHHRLRSIGPCCITA